MPPIRLHPEGVDVKVELVLFVGLSRILPALSSRSPQTVDYELCML